MTGVLDTSAKQATPFIPMILAQYTPSDMGLIVIVLLALIVGAYNVLGLVERWQNIRRAVRADEPAKTTAGQAERERRQISECELIHRRVDERFEEMSLSFGRRVDGLGRSMHELRMEIKDDIKDLQANLTDNIMSAVKSVSRVEGELHADGH